MCVSQNSNVITGHQFSSLFSYPSGNIAQGALLLLLLLFLFLATNILRLVSSYLGHQKATLYKIEVRAPFCSYGLVDISNANIGTRDFGKSTKNVRTISCTCVFEHIAIILVHFICCSHL